MAVELFRHEMLASVRELQRYGYGSNVPPPAHWLVATTAILVIAAITALLIHGSYAASEQVRGYLEPDAGSVRIFAPRQGTVAELLVGNGDVVAEGTPLLLISAERRMTGASADARVIAALQAELAVVLQQLERRHTRHQGQRARQDARLRNADQELALLQSQLELQAASVTLGAQQLERMTSLAAQGHVPASDLEKQRIAQLQQQLARSSLLSKITGQQGALESQRSERAELLLSQQDELADLQTRQHQLTRALTDAEAMAAFTLKAPSAGVVSGLHVRRGDRVTAMVPALTIIPASVRFRAVLLVPSRARGLLAPGDNVRVRVDAFPYQKFGVLRGRIDAVSQSPLLPGEGQFPVPVIEASYRVDVTLAEQSIRAGDDELAFAAGMSVVAEIMRERRHLYEWLLAPLQRAGRS